MARTTPWLFYQFFVLPNYLDFLAKPNDIRLGFNASVSAFQQADIFYNFYKRHDLGHLSAWPNKTTLLVDLCKREPHFRTAQSIATVYKHLYASGGHYEIGSPMAMWGVTSPNGSGIELKWGEGVSERDVIIRRRDGTKSLLKEVLKSVVESLWPKVLPEQYRYCCKSPFALMI